MRPAPPPDRNSQLPRAPRCVLAVRNTDGNRAGNATLLRPTSCPPANSRPIASNCGNYSGWLRQSGITKLGCAKGRQRGGQPALTGRLANHGPQKNMASPTLGGKRVYYLRTARVRAWAGWVRTGAWGSCLA